MDGRGAISREYGGYARPQDYWSPRNADYNEGGLFTLRRGLENSINVVTAHLLDGGISTSPEKSLDEVCATAVAAKIYSQCVRYYPFVLGAEPVRMIDLAAFYAAVANEGALPQPHGIDSIEENGHTIYEYPKTPLPWIGAADRASFYQLKTMLQGVVARGTARAIAGLSPYVAGKTGTTEDAVDGWFIGFTNDVTVAVWVGFDNADHKRRSLGANATGARVALPIFQPIIEAVWAQHIAPKVPLSGPSAEARRMLVDAPIDYLTGSRVAGGGFIEHFRRDANGQVEDTQYQIASREGYYYGDQFGNNDQGYFWGGYNRGGPWAGRSYYPNWRSPPPQPPAGGVFQPWRWSDNPSPLREFFWGGRLN
jgi:membrane carboxypeptidase/penicillin-binding protein